MEVSFVWAPESVICVHPKQDIGMSRYKWNSYVLLHCSNEIGILKRLELQGFKYLNSVNRSRSLLTGLPYSVGVP